MEINVDKTGLSPENYDAFMAVLDAEMLKQYPEIYGPDTKLSETLSREDWLDDCLGLTVQEIIVDEISSFD